MAPLSPSSRRSSRRRRRKRACKTNIRAVTLHHSHVLFQKPATKIMPHAAGLPREDLPRMQAVAFLLLFAAALFCLSSGIPRSFTTSARQVRIRTPALSAIGQTSDALGRRLDTAALSRRRSEEWNRDYARRLSSALSSGRAVPSSFFLRWLHIPKTGTSFVNTLVRWGCPRAAPDTFVVPRKERPLEIELTLRESFSWDWLFKNESGRRWLRRNCNGRLVRRHPVTGKDHYAMYMHRAITTWEAREAVAMFRLPLQRIFSNYMHLTLHYNESRTPRVDLHSFLSKKQFWSQQAKLLLGRHYRDERRVTSKEALKAALVVKKRLKFVGLTEEFELSSRLFHAMFGGVPHRAQFENVRPGISRYNSSEGRASSFRYDEIQFEGWTDPADEVVYKAARERFWSDVNRLKGEIERDGLGDVLVQTDYLTT